MADHDENDVSVEGSAARAADRGRDQLGFGENDSSTSLANAEGVQEFIADFCQEIIGVRTKYLHDELTGDEAQLAVRAIALRYGKVIMGETDHYQTTSWQTPARLGERIKKVVPAVNGVTHPGLQLFVTLGASLTSLGVALGAGRISETVARNELVTLQQQAMELIMGLDNAGSR